MRICAEGFRGLREILGKDVVCIKVLCIGLMVCDLMIKPVTEKTLSEDTSRAEMIRMQVGGDAFNVASNLTALGVETALYSGVGKDVFGDFALDYAKKLGVSTQWIQKADGPTSVTAVLIHQDGERNFVVQEGASHQIREDQISDELLMAYDLIYIGSACGIPGLDGNGLTRLLERAKALGRMTAMDITGNPTRENMAQVLPAMAQLDYFLPSSYEAMALSGEKTPEGAAAYFHRQGVPIVAIKLGKQGALLSDGKRQERFATYEGTVVDTTGAGDAFVSGFLAGVSREKNLSDCVKIGNGAGTLCVGKMGASGALPSFENVLAFVENG